MEKLKIVIENCPNHSYKLVGEGIDEFQEQALEQANQIYLKCYDRAYKLLMFKKINSLWAFSLIDKNKIDPRDGFWEVNYFYFNISLINVLKDHFDLQVLDKTSGRFINKDYFFRYLNQNNVQYKEENISKTNHKKTFKTKLKHSLKNNYKWLSEKINNYRYLLTSGGAKLNLSNSKRKLFLYIYPVGNMTLSEYLKWRYSEVLKHYKDSDSEIVLVSTKDFKEADQLDYKFVNINRLLSKKDLLVAFLESKKIKKKTEERVKNEIARNELELEYEFFLKKVPKYYFDTIKEQVGFSKFFIKYGPGLLLHVGSIVNKGAPIYINSAKKNKSRVLAVAGRILTSNRLSNLISEVQKHNNYPNVLPDSIIVFDGVSEEVIKKQHSDINIYSTKKGKIEDINVSRRSVHVSNNHPFRITLALQKKRESREMIEQVINAIEDQKHIVLNLKMHPNFPLHEKYIKLYQKHSFINFFSPKISLDKAIVETDVCISAYSSAALEFAKKYKPIIWLKNITLDSLFFSDVHNRIGLKARNIKELATIINKLAYNISYYESVKNEMRSNLKDVVNFEKPHVSESIRDIFDSEFTKI